MSNPAASFEPYRRRLLGLAYRMLGSMADAEDAVQETYLRWHGADRDNVSDPRAFLMTTTTRICLDMLTSARARREEYVGPWLPEPVLDTAALAPDSRTELAEDLSIALLLTLDRLSPLERAAFLLHDVFDFSFSEVATALERSEAACRQLAARARAHVRAARPRGATAPPARSGEIDAKHAQLMSAFVAATQSGDLNALTQLLASDVRVVTDGGGKVRAALDVIDGADRAARFLVDVTRKRPGAWWRDDFTLRFATINGLPGVIVDAPEGPVQTAAFEIEGDVIRALYVVRNPDKLRHLAAARRRTRADKPGRATHRAEGRHQTTCAGATRNCSVSAKEAGLSSALVAQCVEAIAEVRIHCGKVGAIRNGIRCRERRGDLLGDLAGGCPFGTALQRDHEIHRAQGSDVVPQGRMEHATLAEGECHQHGFVASCTVVLRVGVRGGQHGHVAAGTSEPRVQLVSLMHPEAWQTFGDRVGRCRAGQSETARAGRDCRWPLALHQTPACPHGQTNRARPRLFGPASHRRQSSRYRQPSQGTHCRPHARPQPRRHRQRTSRRTPSAPTANARRAHRSS